MKANRLNKNDIIGVCAPSGFLKDKNKVELDIAEKRLNDLGLKVKYGKNTNMASYKAINNSQKPALIIFGEKDKIIGKINYNFLDNVTTIFCDNKGHNPYNSVQAEEYLNQTLSDYHTSTDKLEFLSKVDYKKITEQDLDILQKTIDFLR